MRKHLSRVSTEPNQVLVGLEITIVGVVVLRSTSTIVRRDEGVPIVSQVELDVCLTGVTLVDADELIVTRVNSVETTCSHTAITSITIYNS